MLLLLGVMVLRQCDGRRGDVLDYVRGHALHYRYPYLYAMLTPAHPLFWPFLPCIPLKVVATEAIPHNHFLS